MPAIPARSVAWLAAALGVSLVGCQWQLQPSCSVETSREAPGGRDQLESSTAPACPGPARDGASPCFFGDCGPGLYCDDRDSPSCLPGCASDDDCGPRDTCVRVGAGALGRCEPCVEHTAHAPAPHCVLEGRSGRTRCSGDECGAGQYCDGRGLPTCMPGCASNENCGASESCVRAPGATLGVCRSCFFD